MWRFFKAVILLFLGFVLWSFIYVFTLGFFPIYHTSLMSIRAAERVEDTTFHIQHEWVSYDQISRHLRLAVICTEDPNFSKHYGFDFKAIARAREYNRTHEQKLGASTISQQTAKNVFLWPGRNYLRKGMEAYMTAVMELCWSKKRILEVYLNSIEMGDGVFGVQAAAKKYFRKDASKLSAYEAALIAVSLPNPRKMNSGRPGPYQTKRAWWLVGYMKKFDHLLKAIEA